MGAETNTLIRIGNKQSQQSIKPALPPQGKVSIYFKKVYTNGTIFSVVLSVSQHFLYM